MPDTLTLTVPQSPASPQQANFRSLLAELFMLDQADLDFGIYRIMNAKRGEITRFLEADLLPQVREALGTLEDAGRGTARQELEEAERNARALGMDADAVPRVRELRARFGTNADPAAAEAEVFSHLYQFFRRYYHEGDFLSLRRYKEGVYAIPYEGEEVKLHWANADQYYIKTGEYFRDYTFTLPDGRRVHFRLADADTERNNNKAAAGQERRFVLTETEPVAEENGELTVRFTYRPTETKTKQTALNEAAEARILADAPQGWRTALAAKAPTAKNAARTLLARHLADYTARNTFDYFIHKDLGGFLRRELDFYLKNEVMHLDDIESESAPRVEQYLAKLRAVRRIGHKIIDFLAQLEDFQKRLWLKKKFVVETQWCATLDRVPEALYPEIAANDAQRAEWVRLFAIDALDGYAEPLTPDFLRAKSFLVLDTRFFDRAFTDRLLASEEILGDVDSLDDATDGLLVHSENFQALMLLQERYREQVKCVYLDPPYNTSEETFVYKNSYRHSSWLSMLADRLAGLRTVLTEEAIVVVSIDDEEAYRLKLIMDGAFGIDHYIGTIVVQSNPRGRGINSFFATSHEYCLCYAAEPDRARIVDQPLTDEQAGGYKHGDADARYRLLPFRRSGGLSTPDDRPNSEFTLYYSPTAVRIVAVGGKRQDPYPAPYIPEGILALAQDGQTVVETGAESLGEDVLAILPLDTSGQRRVWRWSDREKILRGAAAGDFVVQFSGGTPSVQLKDWIKEGRKPKTIWFDSKYDASSHGTNLLRAMFGERASFGYPKSLHATQDALHSVVGDDPIATITDLFGGSGTTAHATINLNREDGGRRKYILVEMGEYFDTVLKPRIQKVVYSKDWKDGKPVGREGSSHLFKTLRLESYEDTLNNLALARTPEQQELLDAEPAFREDYTLRYMLNVESRGSQSLLNITRFDDPFRYTLRIGTGSAGETRETAVDLIETFNYLLGLRVKHVDHIRGVRVVQGTSPEDERVLVLWRNVAETPSDALNDWFRKQAYNTRDQEWDVVYVNGDNHLENLRRPDETWKVRLTEEEFHRRMWDAREV